MVIDAQGQLIYGAAIGRLGVWVPPLDGVDLMAIFRAFMINLRAGHVKQGGSTITQQLAKNYFLTPERNLKTGITGWKNKKHQRAWSYRRGQHPAVNLCRPIDRTGHPGSRCVPVRHMSSLNR